MRHLIIASEGFQDPNTGRILSLEEEQDLVVEATAEGAAIDSELTQADRMADMSDALEDLAVMVDGIEGQNNGEGEPTATEAGLIETVANAAVAGTDVDAAEVVPAMESHDGKRRYSAESIREKAKAIWEAIKRMLKQVWEKITSFMYKIFGTIPTLRRRIADLKERVRDNSSHTIEEKKITVTTGVSALSANYKTPSNAGELRKNVLMLANVDKHLFGDNFDDAINLGEAVLAGIDDFDAEKAKESAEAFCTKVMKAMGKSRPSGMTLSTVSGNRFGDSVTAKISEPLLGNISIVVKIPTYVDHKSGDATVLGRLENMRGFGREVVQTSEKPKDVPGTFEMSTATNSEMSNLLDDCVDILDVLEKFQRGKRADEMKKLRGKLETASDKATASMKKLENKDKEEQGAVPYYRAILNYNQAYARWTKDPALPMVSHSLASVRGVMNVVSKSLSNYKAAA